MKNLIWTTAFAMLLSTPALAVASTTLDTGQSQTLQMQNSDSFDVARSYGRSSGSRASSSSSSRSRATTSSRPKATSNSRPRSTPARSRPNTRGNANGTPTAQQRSRDSGGMLPIVPTLGLGTAGQLLVIAMVMGAYNSVDDMKAEYKTEQEKIAVAKAKEEKRLAEKAERDARLAKQEAERLAYLREKCAWVTEPHYVKNNTWIQPFMNWWYTCDSVKLAK